MLRGQWALLQSQEHGWLHPLGRHELCSRSDLELFMIIVTVKVYIRRLCLHTVQQNVSVNHSHGNVRSHWSAKSREIQAVSVIAVINTSPCWLPASECKLTPTPCHAASLPWPPRYTYIISLPHKTSGKQQKVRGQSPRVRNLKGVFLAHVYCLIVIAPLCGSN